MLPNSSYLPSKTSKNNSRFSILINILVKVSALALLQWYFSTSPAVQKIWHYFCFVNIWTIFEVCVIDPLKKMSAVLKMCILYNILCWHIGSNQKSEISWNTNLSHKILSLFFIEYIKQKTNLCLIRSWICPTSTYATKVVQPFENMALFLFCQYTNNLRGM